MATASPCLLEIDYLPVSKLTLDPRNPRKHSKQQIKALARSIQSFGFNTPILVDRSQKVVAGHGRLSAAETLGIKEVPVIRLEKLTDAQARAFAIADNRLTEQSTWDNQLLGKIFSELTALDLDFSLEDTGFSMAEIDLQIGGQTQPAESTRDPADQIAADSGPPATTIGDVWLCGRHRIGCGNALEEASYTTLMAGKKAAMVFTDPPYGVPIQGHVSGLGRIKHREFVMGSAGMNKADLIAFLAEAMQRMAAHSQAGAIHFVAMDWRGVAAVLEAGEKTYTELKNICVWAKDNAGMGSLYRSQHELFFVFKNGKKPHVNNIQLGKFGRHRSNVWRYPGMTSFSRSTEEGNLLALHPTVKPIRLVADALLDCSARGDIVLDPFLGSGTTLIAAERTGRIAYGMELDPRYVDATVRRYEAYTGEPARHAITGQLFGKRLKKRGGSHG